MPSAASPLQAQITAQSIARAEIGLARARLGSALRTIAEARDFSEAVQAVQAELQSLAPERRANGFGDEGWIG